MKPFRYIAFLIALLLSGPALAHGPTVEARIVACYDGDTCTVDRDILPGRDRVRLRNADSPEIKGKCPAEKQLALEARDFARAARRQGKVVLLEASSPTSTPAAPICLMACARPD